jgi:hypothetical protein
MCCFLLTGSMSNLISNAVGSLFGAARGCAEWADALRAKRRQLEPVGWPGWRGKADLDRSQLALVKPSVGGGLFYWLKAARFPRKGPFHVHPAARLCAPPARLPCVRRVHPARHWPPRSFSHRSGPVGGVAVKGVALTRERERCSRRMFSDPGQLAHFRV